MVVHESTICPMGLRSEPALTWTLRMGNKNIFFWFEKNADTARKSRLSRSGVAPGLRDSF